MKNRIKDTFLAIIFILVFVTGCHSTNKVDSNRNVDIEVLDEINTDDKTEDMDRKILQELQLPDTENILDDVTENDEEKIYSVEKYGIVEEKEQAFLREETEDLLYYYKLEEFFINDTFSNAYSINCTLEQVYDEYEEKYIEEAESHQYDVDDFINSNYDNLYMLAIQYIGDDYISILYNDVSYMGGAHPYSRFDGITIDCKTGEQVFASQLLGESDEKILTQISNTMGLNVIGTWDDIDFYLTDSTIVFFYRMPNLWDDVVLQREK